MCSVDIIVWQISAVRTVTNSDVALIFPRPNQDHDMLYINLLRQIPNVSPRFPVIVLVLTLKLTERNKHVQIMKHVKKMMGAWAIVSMLFMVSCEKDTDPADRDLFIGTYEGSISFNDGEQTTVDEDGRVTVTKVGDSYSFIFGSGIPDITGVKFREGDNNTHVSIGEGLEGIRITASSLNMLVINDEGTWTADCTR